MHLNRTGCAWRYLAKDFPPWGTVYRYFAHWRDDGTLAQLYEWLRDQARPVGRDPRSAAAVTDSQSVKAADTAAWVSAGRCSARKGIDQASASRRRLSPAGSAAAVETAAATIANT